MNFIQLVGRIIDMPRCKNRNGNEIYAEMQLEVKQNFRAFDGSIKVDVFTVQLWRGISDEIIENCTLQQNVAIKGRIEAHQEQYRVIAEHVEFITA